MSRRRARQLAIWSPLAVGLLLGIANRALRPGADVAPVPGGPSMTLPQPRAGAALAADADLPLAVTASSIRVEVSDSLHTHRARGATARGHLRCDANGAPRELEFSVPLVGLQPLAAGDSDDELRQAIVVALGARNDDELHFVGRAMRVCKLPYDGLFVVRWSGRLRLGHRENHVDLEVWLAVHGSQSVRIQTVLGIDPIAFVLPANCCLGPFRERSAVEFGLDLAFRAARH